MDQTYNSIPGYYATKLKQQGIDTMVAFKQFSPSDLKVTYNRAKPAVVPCPVQDNAVDCGMCVLGFALSLALQSGIDKSPTTVSHGLRCRWHAAIADGIASSDFTNLDNDAD